MIFEYLTYPGNSSAIPNSPTTDLNIWITDGTTNPGTISDIAIARIANREFYALTYWKNLLNLDDFIIKVTHTDCGEAVYNAAYGFSCFSKLLSTPGVGFVTSAYQYIAISYIYTLRSLNCSIPSISPYSPSIALQNKTVFPEFMTVSKDLRVNIQVNLEGLLWKY